VIHNDVPLGAFWFGWHETPWTPNGFEGWTRGKKRVLLPRTPPPEPTPDWATSSTRFLLDGPPSSRERPSH